MWVAPKTNRSSFCLILKLSHALDILFSVLSRLHGCKHKCTFCRMKHHWAWCDYFQILLLGILPSMEPTFIFRYRCSDGHFLGFGKQIFPQRQACTALVLSVDCTECSCSPNIVIFNDFIIVFNFFFFNFEKEFPFPWISISWSFLMLYTTIN